MMHEMQRQCKKKRCAWVVVLGAVFLVVWTWQQMFVASVEPDFESRQGNNRLPNGIGESSVLSALRCDDRIHAPKTLLGERPRSRSVTMDEETSMQNLSDLKNSSDARSDILTVRFYREVDRWVYDRSVEVEDIRAFVRAFNAVPVSRRKGALHRALNLIPDANVALLAGVLFDKSQPKEIVREVFNDVVNRPEEVKEPILKEIAKDKTHPCYSDAQWIFEVTGERPEGTVADE